MYVSYIGLAPLLFLLATAISSESTDNVLSGDLLKGSVVPDGGPLLKNSPLQNGGSSAEDSPAPNGKTLLQGSPVSDGKATPDGASILNEEPVLHGKSALNGISLGGQMQEDKAPQTANAPASPQFDAGILKPSALEGSPEAFLDGAPITSRAGFHGIEGPRENADKGDHRHLFKNVRAMKKLGAMKGGSSDRSGPTGYVDSLRHRQYPEELEYKFLLAAREGHRMEVKLVPLATQLMQSRRQWGFGIDELREAVRDAYTDMLRELRWAKFVRATPLFIIQSLERRVSSLHGRDQRKRLLALRVLRGVVGFDLRNPVPLRRNYLPGLDIPFAPHEIRREESLPWTRVHSNTTRLAQWLHRSLNPAAAWLGKFCPTCLPGHKTSSSDSPNKAPQHSARNRPWMDADSSTSSDSGFSAPLSRGHSARSDVSAEEEAQPFLRSKVELSDEDLQGPSSSHIYRRSVGTDRTGSLEKLGSRSSSGSTDTDYGFVPPPPPPTAAQRMQRLMLKRTPGLKNSLNQLQTTKAAPSAALVSFQHDSGASDKTRSGRDTHSKVILPAVGGNTRFGKFFAKLRENNPSTLEEPEDEEKRRALASRIQPDHRPQFFAPVPALGGKFKSPSATKDTSQLSVKLGSIDPSGLTTPSNTIPRLSRSHSAGPRMMSGAQEPTPLNSVPQRSPFSAKSQKSLFQKMTTHVQNMPQNRHLRTQQQSTPSKSHQGKESKSSPSNTPQQSSLQGTPSTKSAPTDDRGLPGLVFRFKD